MNDNNQLTITELGKEIEKATDFSQSWELDQQAVSVLIDELNNTIVSANLTLENLDNIHDECCRKLVTVHDFLNQTNLAQLFRTIL